MTRGERAEARHTTAPPFTQHPTLQFTPLPTATQCISQPQPQPPLPLNASCRPYSPPGAQGLPLALAARQTKLRATDCAARQPSSPA